MHTPGMRHIFAAHKPVHGIRLTQFLKRAKVDRPVAHPMNRRNGSQYIRQAGGLQPFQGLHHAIAQAAPTNARIVA